MNYTQNFNQIPFTNNISPLAKAIENKLYNVYLRKTPIKDILNILTPQNNQEQISKDTTQKVVETKNTPKVVENRKDISPEFFKLTSFSQEKIEDKKERNLQKKSAKNRNFRRFRDSWKPSTDGGRPPKLVDASYWESATPRNLLKTAKNRSHPVENLTPSLPLPTPNDTESDHEPLAPPTPATATELLESHESHESVGIQPFEFKAEDNPPSPLEPTATGGTDSLGEEPQKQYIPKILENKNYLMKSLLDYQLDNGGLFDEFDTFKDFCDSNKKSVLNVGFDCEWVNEEQSYRNANGGYYFRKIISYQFSFYFNGYLYEFIFVLNEKENPRFIRLYTYQAFSCILNTLARENDFIKSLNFSYNNTEYNLFKYGIPRTGYPEYSEDKAILQNFWKRIIKKGSISINLISHFGIGDLSAFNDFDDYWNKLTIINKCPSTQFDRKRNIKLLARYKDHNKHYRAYYVKLYVRDTGLQAAPGSKSLAVLGDAIHFPKIDVKEYRNSNKMLDLLHDNFELFLNYSVTDSSISCLYANLIYGFNHLFPMTITSAAANIAYSRIYEYFNCQSKEHFNRIYRGLVYDDTIAYDTIPDYIKGYKDKELLPMSSNVNIIQIFCSNAYFGGYNMCSRVGYYKEPTFDYDLQNAYPTLMCLIPDVNWSDPIEREITNCYLKKGDLLPTTPFVCACKFEFPKDTKFPCIPIKSSGCLIYPLESSGGVDVRYSAAPFIYLALELGAKIYVERGFYLNTFEPNKDFDCLGGSISYAVKQMINDRNKAKKLYGKKSLQELILKVCVNSTYGKTAQNVSLKRTYDAFEDEMIELGSSIITSPFVACFTTSLVQSVLLAACNEVENNGYRVYSATTDGFISNAPYEFVEKMNLYGFKKYLTSSRLFLTNKPEAWEVKHSQEELLNFTTRGNVGVNFTSETINSGVLAHAGMINKDVVKDSIDDRNKTIFNIINRDNTGRVLCISDDWLPAKQISQSIRKHDIIDFHVVNDKVRKISGDFDLKRKINENEMVDNYVLYEGNNYELCNFATLPYLNELEFLKVKTAKRKSFKNKALKTKQQIIKFLDFVYDRETPEIENKLELLKVCISGYRKNIWKIGFIDKFKKAKEKVKAINDFIKFELKEKFEYTLTDYYNAVKPKAIKIDLESKNYLTILTKLQLFNEV